MAAQLTLAKFDGRHEGVIDAFLAASSNAQPQRLVENWGAPWRISTPSLEFKPFPTCAGLTALPKRHVCCGARLAEGHSLDSLLENIDDITVAFPPVAISRRQFACRLTVSKHALARST